MPTSWQCFEFFTHSIHIYCGQKLLGPGYIVVKGMDGAWVEVVKADTFSPHRGKKTVDIEDVEWRGCNLW